MPPQSYPAKEAAEHLKEVDRVKLAVVVKVGEVRSRKAKGGRFQLLVWSNGPRLTHSGELFGEVHQNSRTSSFFHFFLSFLFLGSFHGL